MAKPPKDEAVKDEEEVARRRDEVLRRMIATPPTPHRQKSEAPKVRPANKGRVHKSKGRD